MNFKHEKDKLMFHELHAVLQLIVMDINWYSVTNFGIEATITATVSTELEDKKLNRVSKSHLWKIASDISVRDYTDKQIAELRDYINYKPEYKEFHYLSRSGAKRLAYYHNNGNGDHFHIALHSRFAIKH